MATSCAGGYYADVESVNLCLACVSPFANRLTRRRPTVQLAFTGLQGKGIIN